MIQTPWTTRPIVSVSRSSTYGPAKWLGITLQNILVQTPFTVWSSLEFSTVPPHCLLCTINATSMYTNIDTSHVLAVLEGFLHTSPFAEGIDNNACLDTIQIIMLHKTFLFCNTTWLQKVGTAIGTPPTPSYAQLYYLVHELMFAHTFPQLL